MKSFKSGDGTRGQHSFPTQCFAQGNFRLYILIWFFKLPLGSFWGAARLPNTATWSLSRTTKDVPFRTVPDTERFSSSDLDKISSSSSSSSVCCCRGIKTWYTESLESVKKKRTIITLSQLFLCGKKLFDIIWQRHIQKEQYPVNVRRINTGYLKDLL